MIIYVIKYALTTGIEKVDAEWVGGPTDLIVVSKACNKGYNLNLYGEGKEWTRTLKHALKRCKIMRDRKIILLKKKILKLENMEFQN